MAVKRAALTGALGVAHEQADVGAAARLDPRRHARRRGSRRAGPAAAPRSRTCGGAGTQRERKNGCAAGGALTPALRLGQAEHHVEVLHRLRGGALPEVVDRGEHEHLAGVRVGGGEHPAEVRLAHLAHARRRVDHLDERLLRVGGREQLAQLPAGHRARGRHVAAGQLALVERHEVRLELDRQVGAEQRELLLDLRRVPVGGDLVGEDVLAGHRQVRGLVERAAGAGDALLGVDHHVGDQPGARERREREQRRGRVAAGVGDDPGAGDLLAVQLGEPVDGLAQQLADAGARRTSARRWPASAGGSPR